MPDTKPGIYFSAENICGACINANIKKNTDWNIKNKELENICNKVRGSNGNGYECVVPVSGGKDSIYQAYVMSKIHNLKTLCVNVSAHIQTFEGISNLNNLVEKLSVDLLRINVRPSTQKKIRRYGLIDLGNPNYGEHYVVFAGVARAALNAKAPLVVWGEDIGREFGGNISSSSSEVGSAEDLISNDLFNQVSIFDLLNGRIPSNELFFYNHPTKAEIRSANIKSIYLSHFHNWDGFEHYKFAKKLGFIERKQGPLSGNILSYDNIDEKLCEIHIWFKMLKFGFWRPTDQTCYQIWNSRMTREEAVDIVLKKQYEFPHEYLPEFLEYHEMKENELFEYMEKWRNPDLWIKRNNKWVLRYELS